LRLSPISPLAASLALNKGNLEALNATNKKGCGFIFEEK
jgi:hypothetical protein